MKRPEGISRQEELFKRFIQLVHKHCTTQREVSFYANKLFITPRYLSTVIQNVTNTTAKSIIDKHVILEIKVKEGDAVKRGQTLLVLEAMKMENDIKADRDGKVTAIKVSKGESILEGTDLIIIE